METALREERRVEQERSLLVTCQSGGGDAWGGWGRNGLKACCVKKGDLPGIEGMVFMTYGPKSHAGQESERSQ
mgnify:CR=1 FL=1